MKKWTKASTITFCLFIFANCNTSIKIITDSAVESSLSLNEQPLTIALENTDLTKDFMISFKNYLLRELQSKGFKVSSTEFKDNLPNAYVLFVKVIDERSRKLAHMTGVIYQFRGATLDITLKNTEGGILRKNQVIVNHVYNSETTVTARKAAEKLVSELNLTN